MPAENNHDLLELAEAVRASIEGSASLDQPASALAPGLSDDAAGAGFEAVLSASRRLLLARLSEQGGGADEATAALAVADAYGSALTIFANRIFATQQSAAAPSARLGTGPDSIEYTAAATDSVAQVTDGFGEPDVCDGSAADERGKPSSKQDIATDSEAAAIRANAARSNLGHDHLDTLAILALAHLDGRFDAPAPETETVQPSEFASAEASHAAAPVAAVLASTELTSTAPAAPETAHATVPETASHAPAIEIDLVTLTDTASAYATGAEAVFHATGASSADLFLHPSYLPPEAAPQPPPAPIASTAIIGTAGADLLIGTDGNDIILGGAGNDTLVGGGGDDELHGGADDDLLIGGAGKDLLDGGDGTDTASFADSAAPVQVDLASTAPQDSTGDASGDVLVSIENVVGSGGGDMLSGNGEANVLSGGAGDDVLQGHEGADVLDGGSGSDTASYADSAAPVQVDLASAAPQDSMGDASGDVLVSIENVVGSCGGDTLSGNGEANVLSGGAGDDVLQGHEGADVLDGGSGSDTASYADSAAPVHVDLASAAPQDSTGDASGDVLVSIENVVGSCGGDALSGNGEANVLAGGAGDDVLQGREGADVLDGGAGADLMFGGSGDDTYVVDDAGDLVIEEWLDGTDTIFVSLDSYAAPENTENIVYTGSASFEAAGNAADNFISGGALSDLLDGYDGNDTLVGGSGDDELHGGDGDDDLRGGDGDDILYGGSGSNRLDGGLGNDWLISYLGKDTIVLRPGFGNDVLDGFGGHGKDGFDLIDVSAYGITELDFATDVLLLTLGDDTVLSIGADTLRLLDTKARDVDKHDFIFA